MRVLAGACFAVASPRAAALEKEPRQELALWVAGHGGEILAALTSFLRLPNVNADRENIEANAAALRAMWERRGAQVHLLSGEGGPYVFAHLPVQGPASPFQPKLVGEADDPESRLYARSAADDKGPIVAMAAAGDALAALGRPREVEAKFIFDPAEEAGSPHLEATPAGHAGLLAADLLIFTDGPVYPTGAPTVGFGTRGIMPEEQAELIRAHARRQGFFVVIPAP
jgi:acetylornithine deacetylase/succinyl-diaminopimelate desuccinylase-like protein